MQINPALYISETENKGSGVFTADGITANSVIEIAHVIVISKEDKTLIHKTILHDYYFDWGHDASLAAIGLGFSSLYNHSFEPNASYLMNPEDGTIVITTIKDILAGQEITINYLDEKTRKSQLWFHPKS